MSIDDKLGPISRCLGPIGRAYWHIDEEVHRYYERIVKRWEEDGHERKTLSFGVWAASTGAALLTPSSEDPMTRLTVATYYLPFLPTLLGNVYIQANNFFGQSHDGTRHIDGKKSIEDPFIYRAWKFARGQRLAILAVGCASLIGGGIQVLNGLQEGDTHVLDIGRHICKCGVLCVSTASSIYLVDKEPALLDRAPAWKRWLNAVKNAITPKPTPVPIPVQNYRATEVDV